MDHEHNGGVDGVSRQTRDHTEQLDPNGSSPAVGYKHPPARTRFKKGQSGNRKGRPTGRKSLSVLFDEVLGKTISVREGGRTRRISKAEALAKMALHGAIKGDTRAINAFMLLGEKAGMLSPPPEGPSGRFGYLVVPEQATPEEWDKEALEALRVTQEGHREFMAKQTRKFKTCKDVETGEVTRVPID